jgi:Uma2 family endonuclease
MLDPEELAPETFRPLRRAEYDQLVALGVFEDEHVELLHGALVAMSPARPEHAGPIGVLNMLLVPALARRAMIRVQMPYWANEDSEPEPDLAVVPQGPWHHEHPATAHLIVEVAGSSLRKDRRIKAPLYAASRVTEYWIVNVRERCIEVFRDSDGSVYRTKTVHTSGEHIGLIAFPDVTLAVAEVLG